jgi:tRNA-splicing ligase RtcB
MMTGLQSFHYGTGRVMSHTAARANIILDQHHESTARAECRDDASVIDESPAIYKDIDAVMAAQSDLMEIVRAGPDAARQY